MKYLALIPVALMSGCAALTKPFGTEAVAKVVEATSGIGDFMASVGMTPEGLTPAALAMFVLNKMRNMTSAARIAENTASGTTT